MHDPLYADEELRELGFQPHTLGVPADLAILHTDHAAYRTLAPADLPGIRLLIDGRNATEPGRWAGTPRIVVGAGQAEMYSVSEAPASVGRNPVSSSLDRSRTL